MPLQLSGVYPVDSVMTQRWGHRTKLDGEQTRVHPRLTRTTSGRREVLLSVRSLAATLGPLPVEIKDCEPRRLNTNAITKVKKLQNRSSILLFLAVFIFLPQPAMGKPWINEQPSYMTYQSQICQPLSSAVLKTLLGSYYDETKMATDAASAKKMFNSDVGPGNDGYQGDDPGVDSDNGVMDAENDEDIWKPDQNNNDYNDDILKDREVVVDSDNEESRSWLPRRKVINRHLVNKIRNGNPHRNDKNFDDDFVDGSENSRKVINSESYTYMRRRRRSRDNTEASTRATNQGLDEKKAEGTNDDVNNADEGDELDGDIDTKDKKSADSIHLQLFLSGKDKKQRKKLKQKLRQKQANLSKSPPWECKFSQSFSMMASGVFPTWVLEGRCETDKCFYRLYDCEPIKYTIKLLQRDPTKCNPLPSVTNMTVYEERWEIIHKHVIVGCNCVSPKTKTQKPKSRRRD